LFRRIAAHSLTYPRQWPRKAALNNPVMVSRHVLVSIALFSDQTNAVGVTATMLAGANPIRKVVTLLQNMEKKVVAEGEKQDELFEKFMCYCKSSGDGLAKGVAEAKVRIPELESGIEEGTGKLAQFKADIKSHKADRQTAEEAVAEATGIRKKEKSDYDKQSEEDSADLAAAQKAVQSLEKGLGSSFLQSQNAQILQRVVMQSEKMVSTDRDDILSFLSAGSDSEAPGTDQIVGILKQMCDEMTATIADADAQESKAVTDYDALVAAKKSEQNALSKMIEVKLQRVGSLAVELSQMKEDLEDTSSALAEDSKFLLDLEKRCKNSAEEREAMVKTRQEEVVAIADTIKILNDDDALELFKKTLPGASFLQVQSSTAAAAQVRRAAAAEVLAHIPRPVPRPALDLVELALRGQKVGFDKVLGMIDKLVGELKKEQVDDDEKKEYCAEEFDVSDDKKKATKREISDTKKSIAKAQEDIESLTDEMKELEAGIKALDADVTDATNNRKNEHEDYEELMASDSTAQEVLEFAKNRLNKFYNPKLYKAPPKRELSEEDRITVNMGGTLAPTAAPGGIAGTGVGASLMQGGTAYAKKTEESGGVIAMIDLLIADLEKEMTQAEMEEKHAQEDYEQFLNEAAEKRAKDSKSYAQKEAAHAEATSSLEGFKGDLAAAEKGLKATLSYIASLHADCDFLVKYYGMRKEMRGKEIDGLVNAKAALHGASLLEESSGSAHFLKQQ